MNLDFLSLNEKNALKLEEMYHRFGYNKYKVQRFEEYGFYMENQSFLSDSRILTFSGPNGKLLALKPDITTSIVKNAVGKEDVNHKIYYNESVFRIPKGGDEFKEIHQIGVEFIGHISEFQTLELLNLATMSLELIHSNYRLCFSNTALILILMNKLQLKTTDREVILGFLRQKNTHDLSKYLSEKNIDDQGVFFDLLSLPGSLKEGICALENIFSDWEYEYELKNFIITLEQLENIVGSEKLYLDFSHIPSTEYYKGLVFSGYLEGLSGPALTGGRYDNLLEKMGLDDCSALGFAVDLSETSILSHPVKPEIVGRDCSKKDDPVELVKEANKRFHDGETFRFNIK